MHKPLPAVLRHQGLTWRAGLLSRAMLLIARQRFGLSQQRDAGLHLEILASKAP